MNAKIEAQFGEAQFDFARSCVTAKMSLSEDNLTPKIEITEVLKPEFKNLKLSETKIKFKSWLAPQKRRVYAVIWLIGQNSNAISTARLS